MLSKWLWISLWITLQWGVDKLSMPVDKLLERESYIYTYMPISRYGTYILGLI
jgi:carbon starvation protein CstA